MSSTRTGRSYEPLRPAHLRRLAELAEQDHQHFTRGDGRPEYRTRRLIVTLAQGAALHYLDGRNGVKDLDVWTLYAAVPGARFPADRRETHADFGPSELGRQSYDLTTARYDQERNRFQRWQAYAGRRVDFMMRALPLPPDAPADDIVITLRAWLTTGASHRGQKKPTPWYLAQKAMVALWPDDQLGRIIWRAQP
jgi:hypothetical protein